MSSMIRAIVEIPAEAVERAAGPLAGGEASDVIVDVLIDAFDTPMVGVLDLVEEGEPAWARSSSF